MATEMGTRMKTVDGKSISTFTRDGDGTLFIDIVDDYFSESFDWATPEGFEVARVERFEKDDTYSWHEGPARLYFRPLPPPVEPDTAPLTHRMDLRRFKET